MNLVAFESGHTNGTDPGIVILLTDLILNNINTFFPEKIQFGISL